MKNNIYLTPVARAQAQAHYLEVTCPSAPRPTSASVTCLESIQRATGPLFPCLDTATLHPPTDFVPAINRSDDGIFHSHKHSKIPNKRWSSVKNRSIPVSTLKPRLSCRTSTSNRESAVVVSADDDIPSSKSKQSRKSVVTNNKSFQLQSKRQRRFSRLHCDGRIDIMPVLPRVA